MTSAFSPKTLVLLIEFVKELIGLLLELIVSLLELQQLDSSRIEFSLMLCNQAGILGFESNNRLPQSLDFIAALLQSVCYPPRTFYQRTV